MVVLKTILKFTLKYLQHVSVQSHHLQGAHCPCYFSRLVTAQHTTCSNTRLVPLKMGITMHETFWEIIYNKHLTVASCWFSLSLHNLLTMHGHRNLNLLATNDVLNSASFGHRKSCRRHSILVTLTQFETNRMTRKGVQTGRGVGTALQKGKPMESEYSTFWL